MTEEGRRKLMDTCDKVLMIYRTLMNDQKFYLTNGVSVTDPKFYREVERVLYDIIDLENEVKRQSDLLRDQQEEIERLKDEKERAIRDIDLYVVDAENDVKTPTRTGKGYCVGLKHGLQIAKEILQGIRNHG